MTGHHLPKSGHDVPALEWAIKQFLGGMARRIGGAAGAGSGFGVPENRIGLDASCAVAPCTSCAKPDRPPDFVAPSAKEA